MILIKKEIELMLKNHLIIGPGHDKNNIKKI